MRRVLPTAPAALLATLVFGVAATLCGVVERRGLAAHRVAQAWSRLVLWLWGVRVEVSGRQNLPGGAAVFAANHASMIDIPILFGYLPVSFRIVHKHSLYWIPIVGLYLYTAGHVGVQRGRAFRARRSLTRAAERIRRGTSVAVFPEGTRSPDAAVHPFKRGSFVLAIEAGVPVVPVSLAGVKRLVPNGLMSTRPGLVRLTIHAPMATECYTRDEAVDLAERVHDVVAAGCPT